MLAATAVIWTHKQKEVLNMSNIIPYQGNTWPQGIADMIQPRGFTGDYSGLRNQVNKLVIYQGEIEKQATSGKAYIWLRKFFLEKILGRKQRTLDELFNLQVANLSGLNRNLDHILYDSRRELKEVEQYYETVHAEVAQSIDSVNPRKNALEHNLAEYLKLQKQKESLPQKDKNYFMMNIEMKRLKRSVMEDFHSYNIANETIVDSSQETEFMDTVEDLLRISIQTCERIGSKTKRMERHIRHTKRAYEELRKQQCTISSLQNAVSTLSDFTLQVHNILGDGMQRMSAIANSSDSFYSQAQGNLGFILDSVKEANNSRSLEVERQIGRYLENSKS
jgi:hypothetical protein